MRPGRGYGRARDRGARLVMAAGLVMVRLLLDLQVLPESKNRSKRGRRVWSTRKGKMVTTKVRTNTRATNSFRIYVMNQVRLERERLDVRFDPDLPIRIDCWWRKRLASADVHNYHQELADALELGLEVNDRQFLIRDMGYVVDKENPGVGIDIQQGGYA